MYEGSNNKKKIERMFAKKNKEIYMCLYGCWNDVVNKYMIGV